MTTIVVAAITAMLAAACSDDGAQSELEIASGPVAPRSTVSSDLAQEAREEQAAQVAVVRRVIEQGGEVDRADEQGRTPLMMAAFDGLDQVVAVLLDHGAGVDRRDAMGRTALMYAASGPSVETAAVLIGAGAQVNAVDDDEQWSALMFAAGEGQTAVAGLLLEHGADRSLADADGETAEDHARARGHEELARLLRSWPNPPS